MLETVKYGVGDLPIMPLTSNEFLEEPCSEIHIFFSRVYIILLLMSPRPI